MKVFEVVTKLMILVLLYGILAVNYQILSRVLGGRITQERMYRIVKGYN